MFANVSRLCKLEWHSKVTNTSSLYFCLSAVHLMYKKDENEKFTMRKSQNFTRQDLSVHETIHLRVPLDL